MPPGIPLLNYPSLKPRGGKVQLCSFVFLEVFSLCKMLVRGSNEKWPHFKVLTTSSVQSCISASSGAPATAITGSEDSGQQQSLNPLLQGVPGGFGSAADHHPHTKHLQDRGVCPACVWAFPHHLTPMTKPQQQFLDHTRSAGHNQAGTAGHNQTFLLPAPPVPPCELVS